jgi:hypothetical protein
MIRARMLRAPLMAITASAFLFASAAGAAPLTGPSYPAPGGNSFSATGAPSGGDAGGANFNYSGFNNSYFDLLYWGPQWGAGPGPQAALDGSLDTLLFLSVSGTKAIWQGTTSYTSPGGPGPASCASCPIRLEIDISGLGATPWALEGTVTGLTGLAPGIGAVVDNPNGLDFTANLQFLANLGSGFVAINGIPQGGGGLTQSSLSGAFYSAVPEPSMLVMLGWGVASLAVRRRQTH